MINCKMVAAYLTGGVPFCACRASSFRLINCTCPLQRYKRTESAQSGPRQSCGISFQNVSGQRHRDTTPWDPPIPEIGLDLSRWHIYKGGHTQAIEMNDVVCPKNPSYTVGPASTWSDNVLNIPPHNEHFTVRANVCHRYTTGSIGLVFYSQSTCPAVEIILFQWHGYGEIRANARILQHSTSGHLWPWHLGR